ncbi:MAG: T9SS type A sorting domain-containing protein [Saprospiraceae bacterium]
MRTALATLFLFTLTFCLYATSPNGPIPNEEREYHSTKASILEDWTAAAPLLFVSSNTQPMIGMFDVSDVDNIMMSTFPSAADDADGIYYDRTNDVLFQLNRTKNVINSYSNVYDVPMLSAKSTSGVRNGREISVVGDKLVAAQDASRSNGMRNKLVVYNIFPSTAVSFHKSFLVNINLWGIHATPNMLFAVVDNSNMIAVFDDFFNRKPGLLNPDMTVEIEGLVRTHGITYDAEMDLMLLTDIGSAASATDGALVMISNWSTASADGMVTMEEQVRIWGDASELGNPVDIALDKARNRVYVAERANGGGKVLGFEMPFTTGSIEPVYSQPFAGASAITFSDSDEMQPTGQFFVSSNTQAMIGIYDVWEDAMITSGSLSSMAMDADGIYYDRANDMLFQLNRSEHVVNAYSNVSTSPTLMATSTSDFTNGREIAVSGDKLVVAQDASDGNGQQNRLVVYTLAPGSISFEMAYDVDINLWGMVANGNDLFAIVDNSNMVAVFEDFFILPMGSSMAPDAMVAVENLVRTHGIDYDAESDIMLLTDVGDAASATDGALVMVENWMMASADGMISMDEQTRLSGGSSQLGNPVDVAIDLVNHRAYVAERANEGGKVLAFELPLGSGDMAPVYSELFAGASAVYFSETDLMPEVMGPETMSENLLVADAALNVDAKVNLAVSNVYPVPAIDQLYIRLASHVEQEATIGIYNVAGNLLIQKRIRLEAGENQTAFDVSGWPGGVYFIRVPGLEVTTRFVKTGK